MTDAGLPKLLPCKLCNGDLTDWHNSTYRHPFNDCWLSGLSFHKSYTDKWTRAMRASPAAPPREPTEAANPTQAVDRETLRQTLLGQWDVDNGTINQLLNVLERRFHITRKPEPFA